MSSKYNFIRTNPPLTVQQSKAIHVFATALAGTLASRWNLASQLGMQYGTKRDLYEALGYDLTEIITYSKYKGFYTRNEVAKAVIDRPCKAIWQGELSLEESQDDKDTPFEKAWDDLEKKFKLKSMFSRVDRLTGIGTYGVLLLGFNDVSKPDDFATPVGKTTQRNGETFETNGKALELRYIKPFGEDHAPIKAYDDNTKSARYGLPVMYTITIMNMMTKASITIDVHWSRILHVVDDPLESDIESAPRLEVIYNRLMDFEKVIGGSAEMFWRGARPGYWGEVDPNFQMTETTKLDLKNQLDELEHNLRRWFINKGVKVNSMASQVEDPQPTVNVLFRMVAVAYGIPKRILEGSERGELSSGQDADEWDSYVQARRDDHAEPHVVRPFVDKMIELGVLPKPGTDDYTVKWSDLFAKSEDEMVTIGQKRAQALAAYGNSTIQDYFPIEAFMEFCMGLNADQIDLVMEMIKAGISEEQKAAITPDEKQIIEEGQKTTKTVDEEIPVVPKGKKK